MSRPRNSEIPGELWNLVSFKCRRQDYADWLQHYDLESLEPVWLGDYSSVRKYYLRAYLLWLAVIFDPDNPRVVGGAEGGKTIWVPMQFNVCSRCPALKFTPASILQDHLRSPEHTALLRGVSPRRFTPYAHRNLTAQQAMAALDGIELLPVYLAAFEPTRRFV